MIRKQYEILKAITKNDNVDKLVEEFGFKDYIDLQDFLDTSWVEYKNEVRNVSLTIAGEEVCENYEHFMKAERREAISLWMAGIALGLSMLSIALQYL